MTTVGVKGIWVWVVYRKSRMSVCSWRTVGVSTCWQSAVCRAAPSLDSELPPASRNEWSPDQTEYGMCTSQGHVTQLCSTHTHRRPYSKNVCFQSVTHAVHVCDTVLCVRKCQEPGGCDLIATRVTRSVMSFDTLSHFNLRMSVSSHRTMKSPSWTADVAYIGRSVTQLSLTVSA